MDDADLNSMIRSWDTSWVQSYHRVKVFLVVSFGEMCIVQVARRNKALPVHIYAVKIRVSEPASSWCQANRAVSNLLCTELDLKKILVHCEMSSSTKRSAPDHIYQGWLC
jgi:hypothetical protein